MEKNYIFYKMTESRIPLYLGIFGVWNLFTRSQLIYNSLITLSRICLELKTFEMFTLLVFIWRNKNQFNNKSIITHQCGSKCILWEYSI